MNSPLSVTPTLPCVCDSQPGDYGTLSRDTGEFHKEGSIFDDDFQQRHPDLVIAAPVEHHPDQQRLLCSNGVTAVEVGGNG